MWVKVCIRLTYKNLTTSLIFLAWVNQLFILTPKSHATIAYPDVQRLVSEHFNP